MNLGAILIGIAMIFVSILYVINPLVGKRKIQPVKPTKLNKEGKGREKDVLGAIRDLDFDFQTGKVVQEDYETLRAQLVLQAAECIQVMKQKDDEIEAMIRARLQRVKPSERCQACGGDIHPQDLFCPICGEAGHNKNGSKKPALQITCPDCGKRVQEEDLFCTHCGTRVSGRAPIKAP